MGRPAHDSAAKLIEATGIPLSVDEVLTAMDLKLAELFTKVEPLPGVIKLVNHLQKHKIPMAVRFSLVPLFSLS
jgi:pseudouridine-5'-monophosphatase